METGAEWILAISLRKSNPLIFFLILEQSFDLLHSKEIFGTTSAEKHYEMRLFRALSWIQVYVQGDRVEGLLTDSDIYIATPIPKDVTLVSADIGRHFNRVPGTQVRLRKNTSEVQIEWKDVDFLYATNHPQQRAMRKADVGSMRKPDVGSMRKADVETIFV